jgi:hypothetical protein
MGVTGDFRGPPQQGCTCPIHNPPETWWQWIKRMIGNCLRAGLIVFDLVRPFVFKQVVAGMAYGAGFQIARVLAKLMFPHAFPSVVYMPLNAQVRFIDSDGTKPVPVRADHYAHAQDAARQQELQYAAAVHAADAAAVAFAGAGRPGIDNSYVLAPLPPGTSKASLDGGAGGAQSWLHRYNPIETGRGPDGRLVAEVPVIPAGRDQAGR